MMQEQVPQLLLEKKPESFRNKLVSAYSRYIVDNPAPADAYRKLANAFDSYKAAHPKQVAAFVRARRWLLIHAFILYCGSLFLPELFKPYIVGAMDVIFAPVAAALPILYIVILITGVVAAFGMLLQKYMIDWDFSHRVGALNKSLKAQMDAARRANDPDRIKALQEQQIACIDDSTVMMKQMILPMGYLMLVSFPVFIWMFWFFTDHPEYSIIYPFLGQIGVDSIFLVLPGWLIWSMVCSFMASQMFRHLFNVGLYYE
jgi:uncharacterized membrane protein (DUF106 family)